MSGTSLNGHSAGTENKSHVNIGDGGVLGPLYRAWRELQHGQEKLIRWGRYHEQFPDRLRKQSGHDHCCSVGFLCDYYAIEMRPYVVLDELLLTRSFKVHDVPEGITGIDTPATLKKDEDDLYEYLVFEKQYRHFGKNYWREMQRCYLLQFALTNPECFPDDAREVMETLSHKHRNEALFFDGVQRMDYFLFPYECHVERQLTVPLQEVTVNQFRRMKEICQELRGFREVVWKREIQDYFESFHNQTLLFR